MLGAVVYTTNVYIIYYATLTQYGILLGLFMCYTTVRDLCLVCLCFTNHLIQPGFYIM